VLIWKPVILSLSCGYEKSTEIAGRVLNSMACNSQQFGQAPNVIGNSCLHRRGHAQAAMNSAEIIVGKVQRNGSFEIVELARERQRQSRKPGDLESHGQVLAFNNTGRNVWGFRF
jgi:hypothetical protein